MLLEKKRGRQKSVLAGRQPGMSRLWSAQQVLLLVQGQEPRWALPALRQAQKK